MTVNYRIITAMATAVGQCASCAIMFTAHITGGVQSLLCNMASRHQLLPLL